MLTNTRTKVPCAGTSLHKFAFMFEPLLSYLVMSIGIVLTIGPCVRVKVSLITQHLSSAIVPSKKEGRIQSFL